MSVAFLTDPLIISVIITLVFGSQTYLIFKGSDGRGIPITFGILVSILVFVSFLHSTTNEGFEKFLALPITLICALILLIYFKIVKYSANNIRFAKYFYTFFTLSGFYFLIFNIYTRFL